MSYENFAYYYDSLMDDRFYQDYYQFINQHAKFKSVLELGCGTGEIAILLAKDKKQVYATDLSKEMLEAAYDACVDAKSKFSFAYVAKIIESWNEKGYKKPEDIEKRTGTAGAGEETGYAAYDLELFEEMLNKKD